MSENEVIYYWGDERDEGLLSAEIENRDRWRGNQWQVDQRLRFEFVCG